MKNTLFLFIFMMVISMASCASDRSPAPSNSNKDAVAIRLGDDNSNTQKKKLKEGFVSPDGSKNVYKSCSDSNNRVTCSLNLEYSAGNSKDTSILNYSYAAVETDTDWDMTYENFDFCKVAWAEDSVVFAYYCYYVNGVDRWLFWNDNVILGLYNIQKNQDIRIHEDTKEDSYFSWRLTRLTKKSDCLSFEDFTVHPKTDENIYLEINNNRLRYHLLHDGDEKFMKQEKSCPSPEEYEYTGGFYVLQDVTRNLDGKLVDEKTSIFKYVVYD